MKQSYFALFLLTISLGSCSKDGENIPLVLEGEYRAAGTVLAANPIVMYTSRGQIDNQAVIDRYLKRHARYNPSFSRTNIIFPGTTTLAIRANNKAALISSYQTRHDTTEAEITDRTTDYFVLANLDSVGPIRKPFSIKDGCSMLADRIKVAYPGERCRPDSSFFSSSCKNRPVRVIRIQDEKLFIPQFSWLIRTATCGITQSGEWNLLDSAVLGQLRSGDTLVVQERQVELLKQ
ncbi:hypothetical protein [Hymenobacter terrestris]|uniref:Lipoprotein n=1 Tax=Hymenobacter terrestris TaxID=2748310 RepID=A0ABX2Q2B4_9BACT|nr:hypothetical protein [Hymenobacter terrestris]NVO85100.1 hypothetical protein [Hymenobacter terrestris]